jgi:hypothetical protein
MKSREELEKALVPSKIEDASSRYADQQWLRVTVNAIPYIGGSLDRLLTIHHEEFLKKRINNLFDALIEEIDKIGHSNISYDFLESEEWYDIFLSSLERVARIKEKERILAIGKILARTICGEPTEEIHPVDLVSIITDLSEQEAYVLSLIGTIYEKRTDLLTGSKSTLFTVQSISDVVPNQLKPSLELLLDRLVGKGLLGTLFENYGLNDASNSILKFYRKEHEIL